MNDQTYNGWTNYATWRVNLELFDSFNVSDAFDNTIPDVWAASQWAKDYARDFVFNSLDDNGGGIAEGWALAFLEDVDWMSIARHLIDYARDCQEAA